MYKRKLSIACMMVALVCLIGCATLDIGGMTMKDYGTLAMGTYTGMYTDHVNRADKPNLTDKEREDLQDLKRVLETIYPVIGAYNLAIDIGDDPTPEDVTALMAFLATYYYGEE